MDKTATDRKDVDSALETLKNGGLILYPTDTVWGIGCDATNEAAVEKVLALKGRDRSKGLIVLLHNDNQLAGYVQDVPEVAYELVECAENPLTIVFSQAKNLPKNVPAADGSVGIRVVRHAFCVQLLQRFRKPIVSTSANRSGEGQPQHFGDIAVFIKNGVDYIVRHGRQTRGNAKPSTVMRLDPSGKFVFLRK